MNGLTTIAREGLSWSDVTVAAWARWNGWADGMWRGDRCGCPDDRCIGHHHDDESDCGCLPALLSQRAEELRRAANAGTSPADLRGGRFGSRYYPIPASAR